MTEPVQVKREIPEGYTFGDHPHFTGKELFHLERSTFIFDLEVYPNYILAAFKETKSKKIVVFEKSCDSEICIDKLLHVIYHHDLVGFNSTTYDLPMLSAIVSGMSIEGLKSLSDAIITRDLRPKRLEETYGLTLLCGLNHIDLIDLVPLKPSLKTLSGRMHSARMQDLPFDPAQSLTKLEFEFVKDYCINDLDNTIQLYEALRGDIELREFMGKEYGQDLRSKSGPQIAEAVLGSELERLSGRFPQRPKQAKEAVFQYDVPEWVSFETPQLLEALETVKSASFTLDEGGAPKMPEELAKLKIEIGSSIYQMGIGGLHSTESKKAYKATNEVIIKDCDVGSYYPSIIINEKLFPKHLGAKFLDIYNKIYTERIKAKKEGNNLKANSYKLVLNSSFGKFGSKYSFLYSPKLLLQTTITGQLALLMLIEQLEKSEISVISANTDGIVSKIPSFLVGTYDEVCNAWQTKTGFNLEFTEYSALYSRDVNNYIAFKTEGKVKPKGVFASAALNKNPNNQICIDAVISYLLHKTPISETVRSCKDITKFLTVRGVKGGAHKDNQFLGKVVRWYYSTDESGKINYITNNNKVPLTENAKPLMQLGAFPDDVDFAKYEKLCDEMLFDLGAKVLRRSLFD
jgi:DNA polymerase elongation subunit (family B)